MSDVLSQYIQRSYEWEITATDPPLSYLKQQAVSRFQIALAVKLPYPLLKIWHENVQKGVNYIDFLNATVPGAWFRVSRETGFRIQRRLEREKQESLPLNIGRQRVGREKN